MARVVAMALCSSFVVVGCSEDDAPYAEENQNNGGNNGTNNGARDRRSS
jgi:hypothetical protein